MLRNLHFILCTVGKAMQILQGSLCSRNVCATYGLNQQLMPWLYTLCSARHHGTKRKTTLLTLRGYTQLKS